MIKGQKMSDEQKIKIGLANSRPNPKSRVAKLADKNPMWKGGIVTSSDYILLYKPEHKNSNSSGYVLEHILIMSKHLQRPINIGEIIHHINGNKKDNRIENLMLFKSNSEHISFHAKERREYSINLIKRTGEKMCNKCNKKLPIINFSKSNQTRDGYYWECKDCKNEKQRLFRRIKKFHTLASN